MSCEDELTEPLWHAVMKSAAAPTFFPSYQKVSSHFGTKVSVVPNFSFFVKHVDGAVMINNPSLVALTTIMSEQVQHPTHWEQACRQLLIHDCPLLCSLNRHLIQSSHPASICSTLGQAMHNNSLMEMTTTGECFSGLQSFQRFAFLTNATEKLCMA